jgi:pentose-5-phosphate-3-epimerase
VEKSTVLKVKAQTVYSYHCDVNGYIPNTTMLFDKVKLLDLHTNTIKIYVSKSEDSSQ